MRPTAWWQIRRNAVCRHLVNAVKTYKPTASISGTSAASFATTFAAFLDRSISRTAFSSRMRACLNQTVKVQGHVRCHKTFTEISKIGHRVVHGLGWPMGWVGLGWFGLGWVEIFLFLVGWVGSTTAKVLKFERITLMYELPAEHHVASYLLSELLLRTF